MTGTTQEMGFVFWQLIFGLSFVFGLFALEILYKKFQAIHKRVRSFIK